MAKNQKSKKNQRKTKIKKFKYILFKKKKE